MNDTWEYEDQSSMDTSNGCSAHSKRPRTRSDSGNSDSSERTSTTKHNNTGISLSTHEYKNPNQSVNQKVTVVSESRDVNLGKTSPISIAKTINN